MSEEDLDSEALVFRQIDRVMRTASMDLETLSTGASDMVMDTETWSHRVMFACEFFHAFLRPSMSENEYSEIKDYASENTGEFSKSPFNRVKYGRLMFRKDIEHLHKNNMVFQESDSLVIQDDSDSENMVEPEDSEVSEEVIE